MDGSQYQAARRRVVRRFALRLTFVVNLIFFLLVTIQLAFDVLRSPENAIGMAYFLLIWGTFLILHGIVAFNLLGRFIDRATQRELELDHPVEKPKRQRLELDDEGVLIEIVEADQPLEKAKR